MKQHLWVSNIMHIWQCFSNNYNAIYFLFNQINVYLKSILITNVLYVYALYKKKYPYCLSIMGCRIALAGSSVPCRSCEHSGFATCIPINPASCFVIGWFFTTPSLLRVSLNYWPITTQNTGWYKPIAKKKAGFSEYGLRILTSGELKRHRFLMTPVILFLFI